MKRIKLCFLLILLVGVNYSFSQDSFIPSDPPINLEQKTVKYKRNGGGFSLDNFSIGIKGGTNFSLAIPLNRSSVFSGQSPENYEKEYNFFIQNIGMQMGFIIMYDINRMIKISLQPSTNDYTYKYSNSYTWTGNTNLLYESEYAQKLRFFEIPLIVGFYMSYQTWQPYFQGGIYYGRVLDATTKISVVETSPNLVGSNQSLNYSTLTNSTSLYGKNQFGVLAGAGIAYLIGNTRIGLEANYRFLITNLNTTETQFSNNQVVSGGYDVPDKFKFSNLAITLNVIVPLVCKNSSTRGGAVFCQ